MTPLGAGLDVSFGPEAEYSIFFASRWTVRLDWIAGPRPAQVRPIETFRDDTFCSVSLDLDPVPSKPVLTLMAKPNGLGGRGQPMEPSLARGHGDMVAAVLPRRTPRQLPVNLFPHNSERYPHSVPQIDKLAVIRSRSACAPLTEGSPFTRVTHLNVCSVTVSVPFEWRENNLAAVPLLFLLTHPCASPLPLGPRREENHPFHHTNPVPGLLNITGGKILSDHCIG